VRDLLPDVVLAASAADGLAWVREHHLEGTVTVQTLHEESLRLLDARPVRHVFATPAAVGHANFERAVAVAMTCQQRSRRRWVLPALPSPAWSMLR
jgi:hypothetical protein